jgi:hypothetical protein
VAFGVPFGRFQVVESEFAGPILESKRFRRVGNGSIVAAKSAAAECRRSSERPTEKAESKLTGPLPNGTTTPPGEMPEPASPHFEEGILILELGSLEGLVPPERVWLRSARKSTAGRAALEFLGKQYRREE